VRKVLVPLVVSAVVFGFCSNAAMAQPDGRTKSQVPHKIGLIDMAHIFKNYKKFTDLREDLKREIEKSDAKAKQMVAQLQALQKKMKESQFAKDSPQQKKWRQDYIKLTTNYQAYRQEQQEKFLEKEAQIYKTVYLEVTDAVRIYAKYYNYTLVLRWNKADVSTAKDPKAILNSMNRLVIYSRQGDDITKAILDHLNDSYRKTARR